MQVNPLLLLALAKWARYVEYHAVIVIIITWQQLEFSLKCFYLQVLANFLSTPLASGVDGDFMGLHYVAFDLNPSVVKVSKFHHIN